MKLLIAVLVMLSSTVVLAQHKEENALRFYIFNPEIRYERDGSQDFEDRQPLNLALGYQRKKISLVLEYARFSEKSGNASSQIERMHQDYLLWFKSHFLEYRDREIRGNLFAGAGAGGYEEQVETVFLSSNRTDQSGLKFLSGLVAGGELIRIVNPNFALIFGLEARALIASEFDPNPLFSGLSRFGIQLHW